MTSPDDADLAALIDASWNVAGKAGRIQPQDAAVLLLLWRAKGSTVHWSALAERVWNMRSGDPTEGALRSCVKRARRAIERAGWPVEITAVYGIGYRLDAPAGWHWQREMDYSDER